MINARLSHARRARLTFEIQLVYRHVFCQTLEQKIKQNDDRAPEHVIVRERDSSRLLAGVAKGGKIRHHLLFSFF